MLRCIVIDDEPPAIAVLENFIRRVPFLSHVASFSDPIEASSWVQRNPVDLIFLDIQMPDLDGIAFLKVLNGKSKAVLTTAYSQYAMSGYEHDVVDYLLKPIPYERFLKAAQKAFELIRPRTRPTEEAPDAFMFVKTSAKDKIVRIDFDDIYYAEGLGAHISIYTASERVATQLSMKEMEDALPSDRFLRVHKSFIVSLEKIRCVEGNQLLLNPIEKHPVAVPLGDIYKSRFHHTAAARTVGGSRLK